MWLQTTKKQEARGQNFSDTSVPGNWESGLLIKSSRWELQFCGSLMDPCSFIMSGFVWTIWNKRTRNVPNARQNSIQILTSMRNVHSAKKKTRSESRCILCQWRAGRLQLTDHISLLKSKCVPYYVSIGQILEQKSSEKGVTWCPSIFFERTFLLWHLQVGCILPPNIAAKSNPQASQFDQPQVRWGAYSDISTNCSYFHHASSCCHNVSFELVEYYCGCMSDFHTSSWLMFAASRFQSLRLWSSLQDTISSHRPLPAGWNPRLYCNRNSLKLLPPCIQPIDQE